MSTREMVGEFFTWIWYSLHPHVRYREGCKKCAWLLKRMVGGAR